MKLYKEETITASQQFTTKTLINNVNQPCCMVPEHWHDYYEVLYIMDGTATQTIEDRTETVYAGDIVLIQPGEVHATHALSEEGCGIIVLLFFPSCLNFDNHNNVYSRYLNLFLSDSENISGHLHCPYPFEHEILRLMSKISEEYALKYDGYELMTKGMIYQFLGYLQRIGNLSISPISTQSSYLHIVKCCRYIEENYMHHISLEQISKKMGYTKEYFSKLFKDCVGENYKAFIDYVRISEAQRLISHEGLSVGEVAEKVGYTSLYSFSRAFKRIKGHSPTGK